MVSDNSAADTSDGQVHHLDLLERDEDPQTELVTYIAALKGVGQNQLKPLYGWADHLLEDLYSTPPMDGAQAVVEFSYEGYRVTLYHDGHAVLMARDTAE